MDVVVESKEGMLTAMTYYATKIDSALRPTAEYKAWVLQGAVEHRLPADYVESLRAVEVAE
jgi:hypothetical protein